MGIWREWSLQNIYLYWTVGWLLLLLLGAGGVRHSVETGPGAGISHRLWRSSSLLAALRPAQPRTPRRALQQPAHPAHPAPLLDLLHTTSSSLTLLQSFGWLQTCSLSSTLVLSFVLSYSRLHNSILTTIELENNET